MGLLAENKSRQKFSQDPNNTKWTRDTSTFGHKILRSQGWQPGEFLGAKDAPHSGLHTAANASYIRVALKDDMKGLGFNRAKEDEVTGLDVFSDLLSRLNGKSEQVVEEARQARMVIKTHAYAEQRWGPMRFVRGGLLVGDELKETVEPAKPSPAPADAAGDSQENVRVDESKKGKKSKKRKAEPTEQTEDEEDEKSQSKKRPKLDKSNSKASEGGERTGETTNARKSKSKDKKEKEAKTKRKASTTAEIDSADESDAEVQETTKKEGKRSKKKTGSALAELDEEEESDVKKAKKKDKKDKKDKKEKRDKKDKKDKKERSEKERSEKKRSKRREREVSEGDSGSETEGKDVSTNPASAVDTPTTTGTSTPTGSRNFVRSRFIAQKRQAVLDAKAINQIFMIKT